MIKSIFFARFNLEKGPIVLHQVPEGSIVPSSSSVGQTPLFDFASVSDYVIPQQAFCDQVMTICANRYRIIGHPVCIVDPVKYDRNEFIFNFALVLEESADMWSYQGVVRKLARLLRDLEEHASVLSMDEATQASSGPPESKSAGDKIYALCEMILEDLNSYCECMVPIDGSNTLNLKLFPTYPPPPAVKAWHVPLSTVQLSSLMDSSWDITMTRIVPFIDGVNSVSRIAKLADADLDFTRDAIEHLIYYGCLILLDIFQFSAVYAHTPEIEHLVSDVAMQEECARYVATTTTSLKKDVILQLYASLRQGTPLKTWCAENKSLLAGIDVRRLITFGIIKGFLYRVHRYAVGTGSAATARVHGKKPQDSIKSQRESSSDTTSASQQEVRTTGSGQAKNGDSGGDLSRYLDGLHCFDEISTELQTSDKAVMTKLKELGDVQIIHR